MSDKKQRNQFRRAISFRILGRVALTLAIYAIALVALYYLMNLVGRLIAWNPNTWFYQSFVTTLIYHGSTLFVLLFLIGAAIIFAAYWSKTLGYLEAVANATSVVALSGDESLITLPEELKEIEDRLNAVHLQSRQNAREAREAEQRKNDLIVYLAHDLKTPLTSVIGYLTLLRDEGEISPKLRQKYLSVTLEKAERLEDLINEFFDITRFNLSGQSLERSNVDVRRMLEQLLFEFRPLMDEKNLRYEFIAENPVQLMIDAGKMERVFDNLIRNAVNYSDPGETIEVSLETVDGKTRIVFKNKGIEIPAEKLGRIFEQFYRLDAARSSKSGGAGLGLAIAKEIVELHGGVITAESSSGGITVFTILL